MENAAESYRIELKTKRKPFEIMWLLFLMVYVGIPAFISFAFILEFTSDSFTLGSLFVYPLFLLLLLFLPFIFFEPFLLYGILWRLFGKETIEVNDKKLILYYSFLFWHKEKEYQMDNIIDIELDDTRCSFPAKYEKLIGRFGLISFENSDGPKKPISTEKKTYRKIIRFGYRINKANAAVIVEKIITYQNP